MRPPRCPLCDEPFEGDDDLRAHLSAAHDLQDDPGTVSTTDAVTHPFLAGPPPDPAAAASPSAAASGSIDVGDVPRLRVYDPSADDDRWRPVVLGVGGLLVLLFAVFAISLSG